MPSTTQSERLRSAVAARDYGRVQEILTDYRVEVESNWETASNEQRRAIAREATNLLEWTRDTILATRSHAQQRHVESMRQSAYSKTPMRRSALELNG